MATLMMVSPRSMPVDDIKLDSQPTTLEISGSDNDANEYAGHHTENRLTNFPMEEVTKEAEEKSRKLSTTLLTIQGEATNPDSANTPDFFHLSEHRDDPHNDVESPVSQQSPEPRNSPGFLDLVKNIWNKLLDSTKGDPMEAKVLAEEFEKYFPCRAQLPVQIVDFKQSKATRIWIKLGDIQEYMLEKPADVEVRWIHAPLGIGLYHSSVEDLFLLGFDKKGVKRKPPDVLPKGTPFHKAGRAGWPYAETEIINIRSFDDMKGRRELASQFHDNKEAQAILDQKVFDDDRNQTLREDVEMRAKHLGKKPTFWEVVKSDLPWLLTDGALNMKSPGAASRDTNFQLRPQILQQSQAYKSAYIVRDSFRCFHRQDGFVLSLSPARGVDYLTARLSEELERAKLVQSKSKEERNGSQKEHNESEDMHKEWLEDGDIFIIAQTFLHFKKQGTKFWSQKTAEWLVVFLITEVALTPDAIRSGYAAPSILDAYDAIVHKLIDKKYESLKQSQTILLVQDYLKTIDELRALSQIYKTKLNLLRRLREDCSTMEPDQPRRKSSATIAGPINSCKTMVERVEFATTAVANLHSQCEQLTKELSSSLNSLFQLRSIEQNVRSISADSQSKAVFIFTSVTIIFLPLSFMTSYFGMNVPDIAPTGQLGFWKISAPLTVSVISVVSCLVTLYANQNRIIQHMNSQRQLSSSLG